MPDLAVSAAAAGRRRQDVHVHAPPGNPVLQRRARAGLRLPPRHPAPAQLRRRSRLLRRHPRRASVPAEPAAVRPAAGIVTDDAAGTVTFHLSQADPDFLDKLALLLRGAGPARRRRPSDGPCAVPARDRPVHDLAIPAGLIADPGAEPVLPPVVVRGPASRLPRRDPGRAHGRPPPAAISGGSRAGGSRRYQLRRPAVPLSRHPVPGQGPLRPQARHHVTCSSTPASRHSPASKPGRRSTTPSTAPGSSSCSASTPPARPPRRARSCPPVPQLPALLPLHGRRQGRRLARPRPGQGGAACARVRHHARAGDRVDFRSAWDKRVGSYLVGVLRQLGYRATLRNVPQDQFYATAGNSSRKIQLGLTGWAADIPAASDFFLPVLTCRSFYQIPPAPTTSPSSAILTPTSWPARRRRRSRPTRPPPEDCGHRVDRVVTDQAPWVPIFNGSADGVLRLRPGRELPGVPVLRRPAARPDLGPIAGFVIRATGARALVLAAIQ